MPLRSTSVAGINRNHRSALVSYLDCRWSSYQIPDRELARLCAATSEAAPSFAIFESWAPQPPTPQARPHGLLIPCQIVQAHGDGSAASCRWVAPVMMGVAKKGGRHSTFCESPNPDGSFGRVLFRARVAHPLRCEGGIPEPSTYQIPLSLPVIFCPTAAAVARQGNKLSRTLFRNSRFSSRVVSCDP